MKEEKICGIVKDALGELGIEVSIHSDVVMTALINRYSTIGAIFKTEIFVVEKEREIEFLLWYNTAGEEIDKEQMSKRLKEVNSLPDVYHNSEKWMKIGFSAEKHHILVVFIVKLDKEGRITREQVKEEVEKVIKVVEGNWPLRRV